MSAHESTNTITKNAANSIVGKLTASQFWWSYTSTSGCRARRCSVSVSRTQRRSSLLAIR